MKSERILNISITLFLCVGCADPLMVDSSAEMESGYEASGQVSPLQPQAGYSTSPVGTLSSAGSNSAMEPTSDSNMMNTGDSGNSTSDDMIEPPLDSTYRERPTQPISTVLNEDQVHWTGLSAAPYDWIEIMNPQGPVNVYPSHDPSEIRVSVSKAGTNDPISGVSVEVVEYADGIAFCTRYPDAPGEVPYRCDTTGLTLSNTNNHDVMVTYDVYIPDNMMIYVETASGAISIQGSQHLSAGISQSGSVTIDTIDVGVASTKSGAIDVTWDPSALQYYDIESVLFDSLSGGVKLTIPASSAIDFTAQSTSGRINTDFDLFGEGSNSVSASINGGGYPVLVETLAGSIELRKQ